MSVRQPSTSQDRSGPVVVGVDGSDSSRSALRYGLREARRLGTWVRLAHVVPDYLPYGAGMPMPPDVAEAGRKVLSGAVERARQAAPDVEVEGLLLYGARGHRLAVAATDARSLVVGQDSRSGLERLLLGNVATTVAAVASCPVVVVPAPWPPPSPTGVVLVGVRTPERATAAVSEGLRLAADLEAAVRLVHAWRLPSEYADLIESRLALEEWRLRGEHELDDLVRPWRDRYPDVKVDLLVVHATAARALLEAAADVDELIISRRHLPGALHLGTTARAVLARADRPVRVLTPEGRVEAHEPPGR